MAELNLTIDLPIAEALHEQVQKIFRGLQNFKGEALTAEEKAQLLADVRIYEQWRDVTALLVDYLQRLQDLGYPTLPKFTVSATMHAHLTAEVEVEQFAIEEVFLVKEEEPQAVQVGFVGGEEIDKK
jgi:hypothetical protein